MSVGIKVAIRSPAPSPFCIVKIRESFDIILLRLDAAGPTPDALVAITEGNTDQAIKSQKQFKKHLGKDPLNKILQTQIKQSKELKIVNVEKGAD